MTFEDRDFESRLRQRHPWPNGTPSWHGLLKSILMENMTTVILVRHGQTEWNRIERFRGRYDVPLNETGLAQAKAAARAIAARWPAAAVYSSPCPAPCPRLSRSRTPWGWRFRRIPI